MQVDQFRIILLKRFIIKIKIVTIVLVPVCILIGLGSRGGWTFWLGEDFAEHAWPIVAVMSVGLLFNGIAHVPFAAIQAAGDTKTTAYLHLFELILYVPILFFSIKLFGLIGAAMTWSFRVAIDLIALLIYAKKKNF